MEPTVEQIAGDRYYFETCKARKAMPIGTRCRVLHDLGDIGKKKMSDRWYRVWRKTDQGWVFDGMQFGRGD